MMERLQTAVLFQRLHRLELILSLGINHTVVTSNIQAIIITAVASIRKQTMIQIAWVH